MNKSQPQEKIYNWLGSQLSIARHYGGITINGHAYVIAHDEPGQPLVLKNKPKPKKAIKKKPEKKQEKNDLFSGVANENQNNT